MAINSLKLIKEIREKGIAKCPLCGVGYFVAHKNIPVEKQTCFKCDHCEEKIILHFKSK